MGGPAVPGMPPLHRGVLPDGGRRVRPAGHASTTEFRGFPFIGDDSVKAYRFLLAAGEQDTLWNLQEALYRNQGGENAGWVTDDLLRELASEIDGLDVDRLFVDADETRSSQRPRERRPPDRQQASRARRRC